MIPNILGHVEHFLCGRQKLVNVAAVDFAYGKDLLTLATT